MLNNFPVYKKKDKQLILKQFLETHRNLPMQGSDEWLSGRQYSIGGSEMSVITGCSPYSNISSLIAQKIGLSKFEGNLYTKWGNLFESVTEALFQQLFLPNQLIYSTGAVKHYDIPQHKYSPDGLCVMKFTELSEDKKDIIKRYLTVLLEFKAPFSSVPDKKVPKHYIPQVLSGMCTIDICDISVFVNNMYRKCSLNDLNFNLTYDNNFHNDTDKKIKNVKQIDDIIACGIILFYIPKKNINYFLSILLDVLENQIEHKEEKYSEFYDSDSTDSIDEDDIPDTYGHIYIKIARIINKASQSDLLDLGLSTRDDLDMFLNLVKSDIHGNIIKAKYIKPLYNKNKIITSTNESPHDNFIIPSQLEYIKDKNYLDLNKIGKKYNIQKIIKKFKESCSNTNNVPIAVLPWKLLKSSTIIVEKNKEFLNTHKQKIVETVDIIKNIIQSEEIISTFESYFPGNAAIEAYRFMNPEYNEDKEFLDSMMF